MNGTPLLIDNTNPDSLAVVHAYETSLALAKNFARCMTPELFDFFKANPMALTDAAERAAQIYPTARDVKPRLMTYKRNYDLPETADWWIGHGGIVSDEDKVIEQVGLFRDLSEREHAAKATMIEAYDTSYSLTLLEMFRDLMAFPAGTPDEVMQEIWRKEACFGIQQINSVLKMSHNAGVNGILHRKGSKNIFPVAKPGGAGVTFISLSRTHTEDWYAQRFEIGYSNREMRSARVFLKSL